MAVGPGNAEAELARRDGKPFLGGSDVAAAVGIGFAPPHALWEVKTGRVERSRDEKSEAMQHGIDREAGVRDFYRTCAANRDSSAESANEQLKVVGGRLGFRRYRGKLNFLGAIPDALCVAPTGKIVRLLEIKCPLYRTAGHDPLGPPLDTIAQVQLEMAVWDAPQCDVAIFYRSAGDGAKAKPGQGAVHVWRVYRSQNYIDWMLERAAYFWDCVRADVPPDRQRLAWLRPRLAQGEPVPPALVPRVFCEKVLEEDVQLAAVYLPSDADAERLTQWLARLCCALVFAYVFLSRHIASGGGGGSGDGPRLLER
jgi:YqaJ-like viral recombinase domain